MNKIIYPCASLFNEILLECSATALCGTSSLGLWVYITHSRELILENTFYCCTCKMYAGNASCLPEHTPTSIPARLAIPQVPSHQNSLVAATPGSDESMNLRPRISYISGWRSGEGGVGACAHAGSSGPRNL